MRYSIPFTSAAAVAANTDFGNIPAGASNGYVLRRLVGGVRVNSGAPSNQQCMLGVYRSTARGTTTSTTAPERLSQLAATTGPTPGVDLTWSAALTRGGLLFIVTINATGGFDLPFEGSDGVEVPIGVANGIAFHNIQAALPANHQWSMTAEIEV